MTSTRPDSDHEPTQRIPVGHDQRTEYLLAGGGSEYPRENRRDEHDRARYPRTEYLPVEPTRYQQASTPGDVDDAYDAERARRRAARDRALGTRHPEGEVYEEPVPRPKRNTDKFLGSFGLLILRWVTAAIIAVHAVAQVLDISGLQQQLANTIIPRPDIMVFVLIGSQVAIVLSLVFGMFVRLAGLGIALIAIGALVFVKWTSFPFTGLSLDGETELLLAAIGLVLLCLGGGGAGIDAAFRRRRAADRV